MTHPIFSSSVKNILNTLRKPDWADPLIDLSNKYATLNNDDLDYDSECLNMLLQLQTDIKTDPELPLARLAAMRLAGLDCWNFRLQFGDDPHQYLNPLIDSLEAFTMAASPLAVSASTGPFPPTDMIRRWARDHLK